MVERCISGVSCLNVCRRMALQSTIAVHLALNIHFKKKLLMKGFGANVSKMVSCIGDPIIATFELNLCATIWGPHSEEKSLKVK